MFQTGTRDQGPGTGCVTCSVSITGGRKLDCLIFIFAANLCTTPTDRRTRCKSKISLGDSLPGTLPTLWIRGMRYGIPSTGNGERNEI